MRQVGDYLWVGDDTDCYFIAQSPGEASVLHACKTCHARKLVYKGSLPKSDPHYLAYTEGNDLYLNLVDPPVPLFQLASFKSAFDFLDPPRPQVLIHCNQGFSRAPSLALAWLARAGSLPRESFAAARKMYEAIDAFYRPGAGLEQYLADHWQELMTL